MKINANRLKRDSDFNVFTEKAFIDVAPMSRDRCLPDTPVHTRAHKHVVDYLFEQRRDELFCCLFSRLFARSLVRLSACVAK